MLGSVRNGALPGLSPRAGAGPRSVAVGRAPGRMRRPPGSRAAGRVSANLWLVRGAVAGRTRQGSPEVGLDCAGLEDPGPSRGQDFLGPQHLSLQKFSESGH